MLVVEGDGCLKGVARGSHNAGEHLAGIQANVGKRRRANNA